MLRVHEYELVDGDVSHAKNDVLSELDHDVMDAELDVGHGLAHGYRNHVYENNDLHTFHGNVVMHVYHDMIFLNVCIYEIICHAI